TPATAAAIELPPMNLMYGGSAERINSLLDAGDILLSAGVKTETNNVAPPIQAIIEPTCSTTRTRNTASAILVQTRIFLQRGFYLSYESLLCVRLIFCKSKECELRDIFSLENIE